MTLPGVSAMSAWKLRPLSGMFSMNCRSTVVATEAEVSICPLLSADTVTESLERPDVER